jgi:hypothetical protein
VKPPYFHDGLEDFVQLVVPILRERGLFPPTTRARRCAIIDAVEVDDRAIRIVGSKDILQAAVDSKQTDNGNVGGFVRKWCAILSYSGICAPGLKLQLCVIRVNRRLWWKIVAECR